MAHNPIANAESKGYDESPPRNGVIFFYAVLTCLMLVGVRFLLDSYFAKTMDAEVQAKVLTVGLDEVKDKKASEKAKLEQDGIEAAMKAVAQRGRAASPLIGSESGKDKPEVQGWSQLGRQVGEVAPAAEGAAKVPAAAFDPEVVEGAQ